MDFEKILEEAIRTLQADRAAQVLNALLWWAETRDLPTIELRRLCEDFEQFEDEKNNFQYILEELEAKDIREAAKKVESISSELTDRDLEIDRLRNLLSENAIPWDDI